MEQSKIFLEKNKVFKDDKLDVKKFNLLDTKIQAEIIKLILNDIYTGSKEINVDNKHVLKCLKLTCDEFDNNVHLPLGLLVKKENNYIEFIFQKRVGMWFIIGLLGALLFTVVGATYSAFNYIKLKDLNKDIDGDGVADINIDIDNDEEAEINIDLDGDDKPDVNIDYKANRQLVFNVVDGDNIINPANVLDEEGICIRNCDTNGDGWPDTNLDVDNTGTPKLDLDLNHDDKADMNLDMNGDGECDLHCDTDDDAECDEFCLPNSDMSEVIISINGSSEIVGNTTTTNESATLEIEYVDRSDVVIQNILPDDMEGEGSVIPPKLFTVKNKSPYYVQYHLKWENVENTFSSGNFKYAVACLERCKSFEFISTPDDDGIFIRDIMIAPNQTHSYTVSFKLQGTNAPQNYDKDKIFAGKIQVVYEGD